jgi:hypothetical protein
LAIEERYLVMLLSYHAQSQQARRNVSEADMLFVLEHGQQVYTAGAMHVFLGDRNLPRDRALYQRYAHLEGTVLVVQAAWPRRLVTVYRNRQALKAIRAKKPYNRRPSIGKHVPRGSGAQAEACFAPVEQDPTDTRGASNHRCLALPTSVSSGAFNICKS